MLESIVKLFATQESGEEAARLAVFIASALFGMVCHWYKKWYKKETETKVLTYFFKRSVKSSVFALIGVVVMVAAAWVLGLVSNSSPISLVFQGLLIGFASNSMFNKDGTLKTLGQVAQETLSTFGSEDEQTK